MIETLPLDTIEKIVNTLPVEISFVDATDTVRYYSHEGKRVFARTPAVIGKKVQDCHPRQSVHKVQEIIDDFRSGKRESAEFWIDLGEKKIYIRYFAVRDNGNNYAGTLEVTQDITAILAIKGEKRLL